MVYRRIIALFIWPASAAAKAAPGVADSTSSNLPIVTIDTGGKAIPPVSHRRPDGNYLE